MNSRFYEDPHPNTHQSNRAKNDFLAGILVQLGENEHVKSTKRIDSDEDHGWEITFQ